MHICWSTNNYYLDNITVCIAGWVSVVLLKCTSTGLMTPSLYQHSKNSWQNTRKVHNILTAILFIHIILFISACPLELSRKYVTLMFFKGEVEHELRETPQMLPTFRFKSDSDLEKYMNVERKHCLYPHEQQQSCTKKGNSYMLTSMLFTYIAKFCRLWTLLGGRWPLETAIHALHISCCYRGSWN